jgi:hypothetical protein
VTGWISSIHLLGAATWLKQANSAGLWTMVQRLEKRLVTRNLKLGIEV